MNVIQPYGILKTFTKSLSDLKRLEFKGNQIGRENEIFETPPGCEFISSTVAKDYFRLHRNFPETFPFAIKGFTSP